MKKKKKKRLKTVTVKSNNHTAKTAKTTKASVRHMPLSHSQPFTTLPHIHILSLDLDYFSLSPPSAALSHLAHKANDDIDEASWQQTWGRVDGVVTRIRPVSLHHQATCTFNLPDCMHSSLQVSAESLRQRDALSGDNSRLFIQAHERHSFVLNPLSVILPLTSPLPLAL